MRSKVDEIVFEALRRSAWQVALAALVIFSLGFIVGMYYR